MPSRNPQNILLAAAILVANGEARRQAELNGIGIPWNTFLTAYSNALENEMCIPNMPNLDEAASYCAKESMAKLPAAITTFNSELNTVPKVCAHSRSEVLAGKRMTVLATIELVMAACKPLREGWWEEGKAWAPLFRDGPEPFVKRFSEEAFNLLCSELDMPPEKIDEAAKMCALEASSKLEGELSTWKQDYNTRAKFCEKATRDPQMFVNEHVVRLCSTVTSKLSHAKVLEWKASFPEIFAKEMKHLFCSATTIQGVQLPDHPKEAAALCIEKASAEFPKLLQQYYYKKNIDNVCVEKAAAAFEDRHFREPCHKLFDQDWAAPFLTDQAAFKKEFARLLYERTCLSTRQKEERRPKDEEQEQEEDPKSMETVAKTCAAITAKELPQLMEQADPEFVSFHPNTPEKLCKLASDQNNEGKGYEILTSKRIFTTCKLLSQDKWRKPVVSRVDDFLKLYSQELFSRMCSEHGLVYTLGVPATIDEAAQKCAKRSAVLVRDQMPNWEEQYNSVEKICKVPEKLSKAVREDSTGSMWCEEIRDLWLHGGGPWADIFNY